jgi:LysM repeat protein
MFLTPEADVELAVREALAALEPISTVPSAVDGIEFAGRVPVTFEPDVDLDAVVTDADVPAQEVEDPAYLAAAEELELPTESLLDDLDLDEPPELEGEQQPYGLAGYSERAAVALALCLPHLARLGSGSLGIVGNPLHRYGYHLSRNRLVGTGNGRDYSLTGARNTGGPNDVACALDVKMGGWPAARAWVSWVRAERAAGRLPEVAEIIGSPDGRRALYAADSTGWRWVPYQGSGHVAWAHIAVYRRYADSPSLAGRILGRWTRSGLIVPPKPKPTPAPKPPAATSATYTVKAGDTLIGIGRRTGVRWQSIALWNGVRAPYRIHAGDVLRLRAPAVKPKPPAPRKRRTYTVQRGDTLIGIGRRTKVPWTRIAKLNRLGPPYHIERGDELFLE